MWEHTQECVLAQTFSTSWNEETSTLKLLTRHWHSSSILSTSMSTAPCPSTVSPYPPLLPSARTRSFFSIYHRSTLTFWDILRSWTPQTFSPNYLLTDIQYAHDTVLMARSQETLHGLLYLLSTSLRAHNTNRCVIDLTSLTLRHLNVTPDHAYPCTLGVSLFGFDWLCLPGCSLSPCLPCQISWFMYLEILLDFFSPSSNAPSFRQREISTYIRACCWKRTLEITPTFTESSPQKGNASICKIEGTVQCRDYRVFWSPCVSTTVSPRERQQFINI